MRRLIYFLLLSLAAFPAHARTWTDSQGRTMEAEAVSVGEDTVTFRKADGGTYSFPMASLSEADQAYLKEQLAAGELSVEPLKPTTYTSWLEANLVSLQGGKLKRERTSDIPQARYIALYYSAHWCPPCRAFTPKLVSFYNEQKAKHPDFEIIFISSDKDEEAMAEYMRVMDMPWPGLDYDKRKSSDARKKTGNGIPCLTIVDREGNLLMDSYQDGKYIGPTRVMNQLAEWLSE
ncbi:redoxin domain-containing protein [Ruficoccus amylovorans]|uniref:Redoxin domain-containing protein n=1 Tax=Ruficoccus amylovorans TaxID=1804625 RepID=A0A842HEX4_9BACT|nr:thioredoxin-like domain-containing protein [Ruficoccus amylovorans]MBC2595155.1 redoxin domain-containing protein [Ruficoccus amylovorans]